MTEVSVIPFVFLSDIDFHFLTGPRAHKTDRMADILHWQTICLPFGDQRKIE